MIEIRRTQIRRDKQFALQESARITVAALQLSSSNLNAEEIDDRDTMFDFYLRVSAGRKMPGANQWSRINPRSGRKSLGFVRFLLFFHAPRNVKRGRSRSTTRYIPQFVFRAASRPA